MQPLQAKLAVNPPGDRYEREADAVADRVMRMEAPGAGGGGGDSAPAPIQRRCDACAEEDMQRAGAGTPAGDAGAKVAAVQGGRALTPAERYFFEPRFGADFSGVRLHTGPAADAAARSVGALAYTRGSDIVFREGSYLGPEAPESRRLLAHELTHVVQQGATGPAPSPGAAGRGLQRQEAPAALEEEVGMGLEGEPPTPLGTEPRRSAACSPARSLPVSESFDPFIRGVTYSVPFHAPAGRAIDIDVSAEYETSPSVARATFGVDVYQCCVVADSRVTPTQAIGTIGLPGHPAHLRTRVTLSDECTWSSRYGEDFIYYLRIYNANQGDRVRITYSVS
jgi:hypothetical protein